MTTETSIKLPPYPERDALNKAQARARRAFSRTFREGVRHDPKLIPDLERLVLEAVETLNRIAADAEALEQASARHQRELKRQQDKTRAILRKAERQGSTRAVKALERLDSYLASRRVPDRDDG